MLMQLLERPWLCAVTWAMLYNSDHALTIACARLYRRQSVIAFEGSYEITPAFQSDVDALRALSPRFLLALTASTAYVWIMAVVVGTIEGGQSLFAGIMGALILLQLSVHTRHVRNWFLFSHIERAIRGRAEYARGPMLRSSALDLLSFSLLYLVL
ncbi:MAG TPA: hypothetical protein VF147_03150, partial [Vicinamibacterales bacterium]